MTTSKLNSTTITNKKFTPLKYRARSINTNVADGRRISAGAIVTSQATAFALPSVNSVVRRRQAKINGQKLFNGNHLHIIARKPQANIVTEKCLVA